MNKKRLSLFALMLSCMLYSQEGQYQSAQLELSDDPLNSQQTNYKRISINNPNEYVLNQLDELGIDLTCGVIIKDDQISMELFQYELDLLENEGILYEVIIDDLQKFYSERAFTDLPKARAQLEAAKAGSVEKSYSVNEIINNVGQYDDCGEIDWAVPANWNLNPNASPNSFGGCLNYAQVLQELDDMRALYPNLISARLDASPTNQTTTEGRTVYYVRISDNPDTNEAGEPETLYTSLVHSREAATIMNQLYFMWYLLENYATDTAIQNLLNNQELYFIPVFNPDGFVYNETVASDGGGGQRKNRRINGSCGTYTEGIDLNRNSRYYYNNGGSSSDPCNQTYRGSTYFSEPETQIMRDFFIQHDFKLALNHHSFKNAMLHAYAGTTITNPRPDEYSKYNHDMTFYNRYAHGPSTSISSLNSGNMNDWMLGGPADPGSGDTGSGKNTLAWTPENGLSSEGTGGTYGGFWPQPSNFLPIAKRAMRPNFMAAYFSGKYAKLHDLNQSDMSSLAGNLNFAIENLGQTASDFTLTLTPVSSNILTLGGPSTQTGMSVLQQNNVAISYTLAPTVQANDEIEFKVVLTNDYVSDNVLYEANIIKRFNPTVIFSDDPDTDNLTNWTSSGGNWFTTSDSYSGTTAITTTPSAPYANNDARQLQMVGTINLSGLSTVLIQYYAKWDLERSFDYVQIEGSTNGSTWTPLCGKLTKPGAPDANNTYSGKSGTNNDFQPDGEDLYDGDTQDRWNMEEIVIDVTTNSFLHNQNTVYLRFDFRTDGTNREDSYVNVDFEGFFFDDFKVINMSVPDTDPPTAPANLNSSNTTDTSTDLSWDASTDNVGVTDYEVFQDAVSIATVPGTSFQVTGLLSETAYDFYVVAKDAAGNISPPSNTINVTTLAGPTCNDGIQNGDETGIDCGGTTCPPCLTVTLNEGYFETGFDEWTDGGNDCARVLSSNSFEGSYSIRLRDNSGTSSSMTSPSFDLTLYESVEISFYAYPNSMENGEDLWLQFNSGSGWNTLNTYVSGSDFQNGNFFTDTVSISSSQYTFSPNSQFRFRCDASSNNDQVYMDQIITIGTLSGPPDTEPPTAPANLIASNITEFSTDLSWDPSTDNVGVSGYDVYQDGIMIANETSLTYQVMGLTENTSYDFHVIARDAAGNSSVASNTETVTTLVAPSCNDGEQNGDETGVDCGGSVCPPCELEDVILNQGFFESGWDGWEDGGNDCARYFGSNSFEGNYSIRIRDNSGVSSSMTLSNIDVSPFEKIEIDFYFYVNSMENGEDFWLRFYDGSSWITIQTWISGTDIFNNNFHSATVTIDRTEYNFDINSGFRFQNDASGNNDAIYIDAVTITGIFDTTAMAVNEAPSEGLNDNQLNPGSNFFNELRIFPNPVKSDILNITGLTDSDVNYSIYNVHGQIVMSGRLKNKKINVQNLKSGVYFIEVNRGFEKQRKRFIRQ